jgi:Trk-type K+ transport system membrane component
VEGTAAFLIFHYVPFENFSQPGEKLFFALFTAVSAFCNAGFATLTNGLYEEGFRDGYTIHWVIGFAIILGGIGFPVVMNYYSYLKHVIVGRIKFILNIQKYQHAPRVSSVNSRLVVYRAGILLMIGTVFYAVFEQNNALQGLSTFGKITTIFFGAVTSRTAGFNTVYMTLFAAPTILIYLMLMWMEPRRDPLAQG